MADVTPDIRAEVEQIASDADMPLAPLYGALIGSDSAKLSETERMAKLHRGGRRLRQGARGNEDAVFGRSGGDAAAFRGRTAIGARRLRGGAGELTAAAEIDSRSRQALKTNYVERTLSEAATHTISGGAANAELAYALAIADFEKAVALYGEAGDELAAGTCRSPPRGAVSTLAASTPPSAMSVAPSTSTRRCAAMPRSAPPAIRPIPASGAIWRSSTPRSAIRGSRNGDLSGALESYRAALALLEKIIGTAAPKPEWLSDLAITNDDIGDVLLTQGDLSRRHRRLQERASTSSRLSPRRRRTMPDGSAT